MREIGAADVEHLLNFAALADAIEKGHKLERAQINDSFLRRRNDTLLLRSAWIDGLGIAVKAATIFPGNKQAGLLSVQGAVTLYDDQSGSLQATLDFDLVTRYKTIGDSYLAARHLARKDTKNILIVGAGRIAQMALRAYGDLFANAQFHVWNHKVSGAELLASQHDGVTVVTNLAQAVRHADLVCCATLSSTPLIEGHWLQPGQHLDLIGAFKSDMREADDVALCRSRIFVDSRDTTLHHIGELCIPLATGVIHENDVIADFYDIASGRFARQSPEQITLFKNGGGAHLDLITARYILDQAQAL